MDNKSKIEKRLYSVAEAMFYLNIKGRNKFKSFVEEEKLPHVLVGKQKFYDKKDLDNFIEEKKSPIAS